MTESIPNKPANSCLWLLALCWFSSLGNTADGQGTAQEISDDEVVNWVAKQVRARQPHAEEKRFDEIGWARDLRTAIQLGKEHNRPIFLFTMDGRVNTGRC